MLRINIKQMGSSSLKIICEDYWNESAYRIVERYTDIIGGPSCENFFKFY